jgi:2-dehydro-3-deoxygalactonokinase
MGEAAFIAGDWGLSRLRLSLCDGAGAVLVAREGPGVADANGRFAECLESLSRDWPAVPVMLCGMVGSDLGWKAAPYVAAPVAPAELAAHLTVFACNGRRVAIAPGVRALSPDGAPQVMRGEETQVLGALTLLPEIADALVCLPGTHTKWVTLRGGVIQTVVTAVAGELFALISDCSSLCAGAAAWDGCSNDAFRRGVARSAGAPLLQTLFEVRARRLTGDLEDGRAFLSGLLIGSDVAVARGSNLEIVVIGAPHLTALYCEALGGGKVIDGGRASLAGLCALRRD